MCHRMMLQNTGMGFPGWYLILCFALVNIIDRKGEKKYWLKTCYCFFICLRDHRRYPFLGNQANAFLSIPLHIS